MTLLMFLFQGIVLVVATLHVAPEINELRRMKQPPRR